MVSDAAAAGDVPAALSQPHHHGDDGRRTRGVGDNPVLWREIRRPLLAKRWQRWVGAILCVALLLLTYVLLANQYTNELGQAEARTSAMPSSSAA